MTDWITRPADIAEGSFAIIQRELAEAGHTFEPNTSAVIERIIHSTADFEFAGGLFSYLIEASNADLFITAFNGRYASNGGDEEDASDFADDLSLIKETTGSFGNIGVFSGCVGGDCTQTLNDAGTLTLSFDVVSDTNYFLGADAEVDIGTQVIPVPAAVWLFGSALVGFVLISGRKNAA